MSFKKSNNLKYLSIQPSNNQNIQNVKQNQTNIRAYLQNTKQYQTNHKTIINNRNIKLQQANSNYKHLYICQTRIYSKFPIFIPKNSIKHNSQYKNKKQIQIKYLGPAIQPLKKFPPAKIISSSLSCRGDPNQKIKFSFIYKDYQTQDSLQAKSHKRAQSARQTKIFDYNQIQKKQRFSRLAEKIRENRYNSQKTQNNQQHNQNLRQRYKRALSSFQKKNIINQAF